MDFKTVKLATEKWIISQKSCLKLVTANEKDRRLNFILPSLSDLSFYLVCPKDKDDKHSWSVWSDCDDTTLVLHSVQDCLSSSKERSIEEVLQLVTASLRDSAGSCGEGKSEDESSEEEDDTEFYYPEEEDVMGDNGPSAQSITTAEAPGETADDFFTGDGSPIAVQRLLQDLKNLRKGSANYGIAGSPKNDNLFIWEVKLMDIPTDTRLGKDLHAYAKKYKREPVVNLEMKFPKEYPMCPPFVRVIRPRFKFLTGHVTIGGSICMEMLTKSGWIPTNDIEGILIQIRCEILSDPKASLDSNPDREYDEKEAKIAFERMTMKYGWDR